MLSDGECSGKSKQEIKIYMQAADPIYIYDTRIYTAVYLVQQGVRAINTQAAVDYVQEQYDSNGIYI